MDSWVPQFLYSTAVALVLAGLGFILMSPYRKLGSGFIASAPMTVIVGYFWAFFLRVRLREPLTLVDPMTPAPLWLSLVIAAIAIGVALACISSLSARDHGPVRLSADQMAQPYVRGLSFRITDFVGPDNRIRNKTFIDCDIYGPAVLGGSEPNAGMVIFDDTFNAPKDHVFIVVPPGEYVGLIGVTNCTFRQCRFHNVAIAGTPDHVAKWTREA